MLVGWLVLLSVVLRKGLKRREDRAGLWGVALATTAVAALCLLHLSWVSPAISQALGTNAVHILGRAVFWTALAGLMASIFGSGRRRIIGVLSCLAIGAWYYVLTVSSAISMKAVLSRHPMRYLIPDGYRGWINISFGEHAPPLPMVNGEYICKVPKSGVLLTSSHVEDGWASDHYFYYSDSGSLRELKETGWGSGVISGPDRLGARARETQLRCERSST